MIVLIRDELVNPPTWPASFRDLTLFISIFLRHDVLIETENPDMYHRWLRQRGMLDFVSDFVRPGEEKGIHVDVKTRFTPTVNVDRITPENMRQILRSLSFYYTISDRRIAI